MGKIIALTCIGIGIVIFFWVLIYLLFAFIFVEFNPFEWHEFWRFMFATMVTAVPFIAMEEVLRWN